MSIRGVNHITLVVSDLSASASFYCDVLGGVKRSESAASLYIDLGGLWLCLEHGQPMAPQDDSHIAFDCSKGDFADLAAQIKAHARLWKDNTSEGASLYFLDPDGHKLELHVGDLESRLSHYQVHPEKGVTVFD